MEFSDSHDSVASVKRNEFFLERFPTRVMVSVDPLLEEVIPAVSEKIDSENRD